jgi:hypothetical protein
MVKILRESGLTDAMHQRIEWHCACAWRLDMASREFVWIPRILAIAVTLFVGAFALDSIREGPTALLMHAIPALILAVIVGFAWRWPVIGAVAFSAAGLAYALMVPNQPSWIATISGPLVAVGMLYLWSWRARRAT